MIEVRCGIRSTAEWVSSIAAKTICRSELALALAREVSIMCKECVSVAANPHTHERRAQRLALVIY